MTPDLQNEKTTGILEIRFLAVGYGPLGGAEGRANKFFVSQSLAPAEISEIEQLFQLYRPPGLFFSGWRRRRPPILGLVSGKPDPDRDNDFSSATSGTNLQLDIVSTRGRRAIAYSLPAQNELAKIIAETVQAVCFAFQSDCTDDRGIYGFERNSARPGWDRSRLAMPRPRLRPIAGG